MINLFVSSTGFGTGKTLISAGLAATMQSLGYSTGIYKPVQTNALIRNGFAQSLDIAFIKTLDPYIKAHVTYFFKNLAAPMIAAEEENQIIDKYLIKKEFDEFSNSLDCTIVDGVGGIAEPISAATTTKDLIGLLNIPVLFVVKPEAGAENNAILNINRAADCGLKVSGVIINDYPTENVTLPEKTLPRLIEEFTDAKVLGIVRHFDTVNKIVPSDLITNILNGIDIESVFGVKISKLEIG